ncbi:MAG TPA: type 4a pilus biogenesis protein PilO [Candidatus Udaeobacter sp.]|nr:type 4a pilus biogenesis protein PilO [Candidatus Udaeobacter sp.]
MNELLDNILERPKAQKIALLAVVLLLVGGLYYTFLFSPGMDEIARLNDSVETARNEKTKKQVQAANLPRLQKELRELDAKLKQAVAQLPNKKEMADLLSNISTKAQQSGLEVLLFRPRAENYQEFYAEVPVDITVKGNFQSVISFFDEVGQLHRLINIESIGFKNPTIAGDQVILETSSVATAFRFLDDAERKRIAEQKAKAAKK